MKMFSPRTPQSLAKMPVSRNRLSGTPSFPNSPFTSGLFSSGHRLSQSAHNSMIIEETSEHALEQYGSVLPVLVTEALTLTEVTADITVKISSTGWAWLVCGRKLFVWKYQQNVKTSNVRQCRELTLPPSDLAHRAELVCIFLPQVQMPAAIAVSPSGIVRYWPNIAHEGSYIETTADLQGQECFSLTDVQPVGCILATTTSSLMQVTPETIDGQVTLSCRPLRIPQSVLKGIGRRVSSFIFGAMPAQAAESRFLVKVLAEAALPEEKEERHLYVLIRNSFQKWQLEREDAEKLLYEYDVDRHMKEEFHRVLWDRENTLPQQLKAWCIDMQLIMNGAIIFMAALNPHISHELYYAFGFLDTSRPGGPVCFSKFSVLKHREYYTEKDEELLLGYKFVLPSVSRPIAYVYSQHKILCISDSTASEQEPDIVEIKKDGDTILGAGSCDGMPLFFTFIHGIVALRSIHVPGGDSFVTPLILSLHENHLEPNEDESIETSRVARLKSALVSFCKKDIINSQTIIDEVFPSHMISTPEVDSALDQSVATLSKDLIDDYPASDPRWAESVNPDGSVGSSLSLILLHQIEDKLKAHDMLISFMKHLGLWNKMYAVTVREKPMATNLLLAEHSEKLMAAIVLRQLHPQYSELMDATVKRVIQKRNAQPSGKLTAVDIFYREVSLVDEIVAGFITEEEERIQTGLSPKDEYAMITSANAVIVEFLQKVCHYRENKKDVFETGLEIQLEYLPWTSVLRDYLISQHRLTSQNAVEFATDAPTRGVVFQQLTDLTDIILHGYKVHLESLDSNPSLHETVLSMFQQTRSRLIAPLIKCKQYERAMALAEKYCDFGSLVEICEATSNKARLECYMSQFADEGFSEFVFKWYLDAGHHHKLLSQSSTQHSDLERFLHGHESLSWLHHINTGKLGEASKTLAQLADQEEKYLSRKKTLISLSKLAAFASEDPAPVRDARLDAAKTEEDLVLYQETLPPSTIEMYGMDPETMRVMKPEELIEMYVSEHNEGANEYDFMKALELLSFIKKPSDSMDIQNLRMHIWTQAILRDSWDDLDTDNPEETIKNLIFFRIAELAYSQNLNLKEFLPPLGQLLKMEELESFADSPTFSFLLKAGYEFIERQLDRSMYNY